MSDAPANFCANCGAHLEADAHFCAVCGHHVGGDLPAQPAPAPTPAPAPAPAPAPGPVYAAAPAPVYAPAPVPAPAAAGNRNLVVALAVGFVVLAVFAGAIAFVITRPTDSAQDNGEIFLESAAAPGPDAFSTELKGQAVAVSTTAGSTTTTTAAPTTTSPAAVANQAVSGGAPGLYGGSGNTAVCEPAQLTAFLQQNPSKAQAWVEALNADDTLRWAGGTQLRVADIPRYVSELTPVTLTTDTRVMNHGYANGHPTNRPAVLERGTAVMIDRYGVPRVKCNCGNPLTKPIPTKKAPVYRGTPWPGFSPTSITVITQVTVEVNVFVLVDVNTGQLVDRPVGTTGSQDTPTTQPGAGTSTTTAPSSSTSTSTSEKTTSTTTSVTTPSSVPPGGDVQTFCARIVEIDTKYHNIDPSIPEVVAIFDELVQLAPPEIRDSVATLDAAVHQAATSGSDSLNIDDPALTAAANQFMQYVLTNCGYSLGQG